MTATSTAGTGGMIPLGLFVLVTGYLIHAKILTWEDPISRARGRTQAGVSGRGEEGPGRDGRGLGVDDHPASPV